MTQDSNPKKNGISDEELQRYFDEALPPSERAEVEARLDDDARLRLEALGELRSLLRERVAADASTVDFSATIDAIAKAEGPRGATPPRRRLLLPLTAVGGLFAAAMALFVLWRPVSTVAVSTPGSEVQSNAAEVETLEVQGAVASIFTLGDGTDPATSATVIWADDDDEPAADDHDNEEKE